MPGRESDLPEIPASCTMSTSSKSLREQYAVIFDFWNNFGATTVELPSQVIYTGLGELGRSAHALEATR